MGALVYSTVATLNSSHGAVACNTTGSDDSKPREGPRSGPSVTCDGNHHATCNGVMRQQPWWRGEGRCRCTRVLCYVCCGVCCVWVVGRVCDVVRVMCVLWCVLWCVLCVLLCVVSLPVLFVVVFVCP